LTKKPKARLTDDDRLAILGEAHILGFGGECGAVAIAMNDVLFDGKGKLVAAVNMPLWRRGHLVGHVGVEHRGIVWDSEGTYEGSSIEEDFLAFGMVDPDDPHYQPLTKEEAEDAAIIGVTERQVQRLLPFCPARNPRTALMAARKKLGL